MECPACRGQLKVTRLYCEVCDTEVTGSYDLPLLARLNERDQAFVLGFVRASGSLKDMARQMGFSYPTVRNILDDIIIKLEDTD